MCFRDMLQVFQRYVVSVYSKCFYCCRSMLQVFYQDVAYVSVTIHICCKRLFKMFHLFQTYVTSVLSGCYICCGGYTHMLEAYVLNVSTVSVVCCRKCFMLQLQIAGVAIDEGGRTRLRPPMQGGGMGRHLQCGKEALAAPRQCGRGSCDSSIEESDAFARELS